ncbi:MAG: ATP-binding protein [Candidatus Thorarchaeota archaeon]
MTLENKLEKITERLRRNEFETQKLLEAASAVLQSESFEAAARAVFDIAKELTGAKSGYVALLSEDGSENEVLFLDAGGLPCTVDESLPMPIRGLRAVAYNEKIPAHHNAFMSSKWVSYMPDGHVVLNNVIFGPLVISGKAEGIIGLANKPTNFTEDDSRIVMALSNLVAIGLEKSNTETELRESQRKLADSVRELQLYASLLRHDLSNDLQLIMGELELAKMKADVKPEQTEYFQTIESASNRMIRLLQLFNRTEFIEDEDNLISIVKHLVNETKGSYPDTKVRFHEPLGIEKIIISGKALTPFVFDNLIRNSVQHAGPNVEVDIHLDTKPNAVILDFVDNGPGFDKQIASELFQKGVSITGGGFGLYLCRRIVEIYQGKIEILGEDIYKKGAAIRVELPGIIVEQRERVH